MPVQKRKSIVSGLAAGAANGFFGGGGGMILVPLLSHWLGLEDRRAFATSLCVMLPLCVVSAAIYFFRAGLDWGTAAPYLIGGLIGGFVGGKIFKKIPVVFLRRAFALFILYGGIRALL